MENQANSKSIILNYGIILGVLSIILNMVIYAMDKSFNPGWVFGTIGFILPIALIVLGIKKFKESNNGFMSWGQAVKTGVGIMLISTLIALFYQQIFENFIEPDFAQQKLEYVEQQYIDAGMDEDQIEASMEMAKKFQGPFISSAFALIGFAIYGFIISAIAGAIMKKTEEEQY